MRKVLGRFLHWENKINQDAKVWAHHDAAHASSVFYFL